MQKIIEYFSGRHIFTNFLVAAVIIGAVFFWNKTGKEELPNINFDTVRISASYPGATAEEVNLLITSKIESALDGIDGIKTINSSSGQGSCSLTIELDPLSQNRATVVTEIGDALNFVDYPDDVDPPRVIEFKSSRFSIINLALYYKDTDMLTDEERKTLQDYCDTLEDKLKRLSSVSDVGLSGYLNRYLEISVNPNKLKFYNFSLNEISGAVKEGNINQPVGVLDDEESTKIKLEAALNEVSHIENLVIRANFEGNSIRLKDMARVSYRFEDRNSISKVNGNEAITLQVTKTSSAGILEAVDSVKAVAAEYAKNALAPKNIELHYMGDESVGVRDRLSIIASNGLLGFILIVITLFIFLDAKSSFWVAMGIPFALASTMIIASLLGNTINNMTLAGVIIVMGMVVDDAIVVAENVTRLRHGGLPPLQAVTQGTAAVFSPILASITTTCAAFIPLFFFRGRFGMFTAFLPAIIFIMLGSSLFESVFILPSHLLLQNPIRKKHKTKTHVQKEHWFMKVENAYGRLLNHILRFKSVVFLLLSGLLVFAGWIFFTQMKFSMFPREETTHLHLTGAAPAGTLKLETERLMRRVEDIFIPYLGKEVVGFNSSIARSRRGGAVKENEFNISIDLVNRDQRKKSTSALMQEWEAKLKKLDGFIELGFSTARFGQSSGSPIDIIIQEANDSLRYGIAGEILDYLLRMPGLKNPEIEAELVYPQHIISINRGLAQRLGVNVATIASTLRTIVGGNNVYDIIENEKETQVVVTIDDKWKNDINSILQMPIQNQQNYLIPLATLVTVTKNTTPNTIVKLDGKRVLHVFADLAGEAAEQDPVKPAQNKNNVAPRPEIEGKAAESNTPLAGEKSSSQNRGEALNLPQKTTPLEIAQHLEKNLFPSLMQKYPSTEISFGGEIADTREAGSDFEYAIIIALLLIYVILALTLNSVSKPFIILVSIPFGCVGIILTLQIHGIFIYGFFSAVGALGLAGVVVNDSIVLLDKLEKEYDNRRHGSTPRQRVANITKTRLRAVLLTTITTVAGLLPTAYGIFGYDSMLSEMMLVMAWGLIFGTVITLVFVPSLYCTVKEVALLFKKKKGK